MFPPSENHNGLPPPQAQPNLEDRLRGLILNNVTHQQAVAAPVNILPQDPLPPHLRSASLADQQGSKAAIPHPGSSKTTITQGPTSPPGRKRLNQAQRRQMNSQLSIPIDPRSNQKAQPVQGYSSSQPSWPSQPLNGGARAQVNSRFSQQSPRFPEPASPYSPQVMHASGSQPSPRQYQQGSQQYSPHNRQSYSHNFQQAANTNIPGTAYPRSQPQNRQLFQPGSYNGQGGGRPMSRQDPEDILIQCAHLEALVQECVPEVGVDPEEEAGKEAFRAVVESACREVITQFEQQELKNSNFDPSSVELRCFGSMSSGFATKASDMDLALLTPYSVPPSDSPESRIPRLLERKLLDSGYGARLLTRTRVPIIKLCEKPSEKLRADLLEERNKWDNGFSPRVEEVTEEHSEAIFHINQPAAANEDQAASPILSPAEPSAESISAASEGTLSQLKQKANQSIVDYYNNAKRVLRKLGGFDLSANSTEHSMEQEMALNNVCKAFISGLSSDVLSSRLRSYASISPLFENTGKFLQRSLIGIWTQVEGERLALAFLDRPLKESNDRREAECMAAVESWRQLQEKSGPCTECSVYDRQLYQTFERLKSMSSLSLVLMKQMSHEQPVYYAARAQKIFNDLKGLSGGTGSNTVTPIVIAQYISGITNQQIQAAMTDFAQFQSTLEEVQIQHRALQLAVDYEQALAKDFYSIEDKPVIERYVTWIRSRTSTPQSSSIDFDLIAKIRSLPDPTSMSLIKTRDRYSDHLEFPKTDIGIQCDINFSADLALHNTLLLRCYAHSDPRVSMLILFVKHWAKVRGINTPYRGSLSSYGYVLMVLHYLVNIANPFVCPNLQALQKDPPSYLSPAEIKARTICNGRDVRFWRNETEIKDLASRGMLNHNRDSAGRLLRGFFEYFAQNTHMSTTNCRGFDWGREVLSLRTQGGLLTKQEKGWTGAKTVFQTTTIAAPLTPSTPAMEIEGPNPVHNASVTTVDGQAPKTPKLLVKTMEETKEIRHRYLFAIEDPFELDHNVARTVTHNGIVSIRDEFRRAWRIIRSVGKAHGNERLLEAASTESDNKSDLHQLLDLIHGPLKQVAA